MSIQIPEKIGTEILPRITEAVSKGLGMIALVGNTLPSYESHNIDVDAIADAIPDGGMAYKSFGELTHLCEEFDIDSEEIDLRPIIDMIAKGVATDFKRWEEELNGTESTHYLNINRRDAVNAVQLWQVHPSEETEAAARHILHYASYAVPKIRKQRWAENFLPAFESMVKAHQDANQENITLDTALRQIAIAKHSIKDQETFGYQISDYDSIFESYN